MNDLPRILRLGLIVPIVFISLAAVFVTVVITFRAWQLEKDARETQKQAIESHIFHESAKIAEEVYLKLDNWRAREKQMAAYFHEKGVETHVHFEPAPYGHPGRVEKKDLAAWRHPAGGHSHEVLEVPLYFSDIFVGTMFIDLIWGGMWSFGGIRDLGVVVVTALIVVLLAWYLTFAVLRRKVFAPIFERMMHLNRLEAISETTQMIAHDVRKPFHMLRLSLQALKKASTPSEVKDLTETLTPTIEKVSAEVDDMLRDIVDLEKPQGLRLLEASLVDLIRSAVTDYNEQQNEKECTVHVSFDHKHLVNIDKFKIQRVVSNLLQNAFHAVERGGRVWIKTSEGTNRKRSKAIIVCIGNSGCVIPAGDVTKLFERFFTKGKQNGTGLGLAIAKKFVTAHGGEIWCESNSVSGTQFYFSLSTSSLCLDEEKERVYSAQPDTRTLLHSAIGLSSGVDYPPSVELVAATSIPDQRPKVRVVLIGDDDFFRDGMNALLSAFSAPGCARPLIIGSYTVNDAKKAEAVLATAHLILIDCDDQPDLEAITRIINAISLPVLVGLHSNVLFPTSLIGSACEYEPLVSPMDAIKVENLLRRAHAKILCRSNPT